MSRKSRLLGRTALPLIAALGLGAAVNPAALPKLSVVASAQAQSNPCAPAAARRAANPCAPANPCAAAKPGRTANPCAPRAAGANPCAARPAIVGDAAKPFDVKSGHKQAPYGDKMPAIVVNYLRAAPYVGTGGLVSTDAMPKVKELGFKTVINLNTASEGAVKEGAAATPAATEGTSTPTSPARSGGSTRAAACPRGPRPGCCTSRSAAG